MGCYDSIRFKCPVCAKHFLEQSKAGECSISEYDSEAVPLAIAASVHGERVFCPDCQTEFLMQTIAPTRVEVYLLPIDEAYNS